MIKEKINFFKDDQSIFKYISGLKKEIDADTTTIAFDIQTFIEPLFFILLGALSKEKKLTIILNISTLKDGYQYYIHRLFAQFIDLKLAIIHIREKDEDYKKYINTPEIFTDKKIHILTTVAHKEGKFSNYEYGNRLIPIIQSKNIPIDNIIVGGDENKKDRLEKYRMLFMDKDEYINKDNLKYVIEETLQALELDDKNLDIHFANILSELLSNIARHTEESSNAYTCFYKKQEIEYVLIVSDNSKIGFIDNYKNTIETELKKIAKEIGSRFFANEQFEVENMKYNEIIDELKRLEDNDSKYKIIFQELYEFGNILDNIKNKNYETILRDLFDFKNKSTISTHQIPRVTMHFGIPLLMKILNSLAPKEHKIVEIFLHSKTDKKFFKITEDFKNELKIEDISKNSNIQGTTIVIKFPYNIKKYEQNNIDSTIKPISLDLENTHYYNIFQKRENIRDTVYNKFYYVSSVKEINLNNMDGKKSIIIKFDGSNFSQFIRDVFLQSFLNDIENICIFNLSLRDYLSYINLIIEITFRQNIEYDKPLNVLFYDDMLPSIIFFGGKNTKELCHINKYISSTYGEKFQYELCKTYKEPPQNIMEQDLFYKLENDRYILLPFELIKIAHPDEDAVLIDIFEQLIKTFLEKSAIVIHIDTGQGYHVDKFFQFKRIFENSQWIKRVAFKIADIKNSMRCIIATDNYALIVSSMIKYILQDNNIKIISIKDAFNMQNITKENTLVLSSVLAKGESTANRLEKIFDKELTDWQTIVRIKLDEKECSFASLVEIQPEKVYKIDKDFCEYSENIENHYPLYQLKKKNPLNIDNFIDDKYKPKQNIDYVSKKKEICPNWLNSVYFGHITRGENHYTYYIDTMNFLKDNLDSISAFLKDAKKHRENNHNHSVIITPSHTTNIDFSILVNSIVFDDNATILYVESDQVTVNFDIDIKNSYIYFVDDAISSANTLKKIYSLLLSQNIDKLDGIFTLVDRVSKNDEKFIANLLKNGLENFCTFAKLNVKPINYFGENFFLSKRLEEYEKLLKNSSLDLTKFQIASKIIKLSPKVYKKIDTNINLKTKTKNFIKMFAVDFIAKNFDKFNQADFKNSFEDVRIVLEFKDMIKKYLFKYLPTDEKEKEVFEKIFDFESEIAILKALSFPPLSYYKNIRDCAITVCAKQVKKIYNDDFNEQFEIGYIENIIGRKVKDRDIEKFIKHYKEKNIFLSKLNVYFNIFGYLGAVQHLDNPTIKFYNDKMIEILKNKKIEKNQLHHYPFAVKMSIDNNKEKTEYFLKNLSEIMQEVTVNPKNIGDIDLLRALFIEANANINLNEFQKEPLASVEDFKRKLRESIDNITKPYLKENDMQLESLYLNFEFNLSYKNYKQYIETTKKNLADILNDFKTVKNSRVEMIYQGAIRKDNKSKELMELTYSNDKTIYSNIDNTWANDYYKKDGLFYTVIRLVDIDIHKLKENRDPRENNPIWFKPIGCLVFSQKNDDKNLYLKLVKSILRNQNRLVEFIKINISSSIYQEAINNTKTLEKVEKQYNNIINNLNHSAKTWLNLYGNIVTISKRNSNFLENLRVYLKGVYMLSNISSLGNNIGVKTDYSLYDIFYDPLSGEEDQFFIDLKSFILVVHTFNSKYGKYCNKATFEIYIKKETLFFKTVDFKNIEYMIYELIINAIKNLPDNNQNPKIILKANKDSLVIKNSFSSDRGKIDRAINKINDDNNLSFGLKMIKNFLKNNNFELIPEYISIENMISITIRRR